MLQLDGEAKPLKIEVSYRNKNIEKANVKNVNGINVYSIDQLAIMKAMAYMGRDRARDLFDLAFICDKYFDELSSSTIDVVKEAVGRKGIEQYDFIMHTDPQATLINAKDFVLEMFLNMFDKLDLINEEEHNVETEYKFPQKENNGMDNTCVR